MVLGALIGGCTPAAAPDHRDLSTLTVAVWMDGDNSLESLIPGDLAELRAGVVPGVAVAVQLDRIPGGFDGFGDKVGSRRVEILPDGDGGGVTQVVQELGEVDMGRGDALSDFLLWADQRYPSDRFAVVMWDHGGGTWIASDDTSHDKIRIDDGELSDALSAVVDARGAKVDVLAFDACNMAEWEVASMVRNQASVLAASEAWVGAKGYAYDRAFRELPDHPTALDIGDRLAWSAGDLDQELTHAAVDLERIDPLSAAMDQLASTFLDDPDRRADRLSAFVTARQASHGMDPDWGDYWMDLGDLAGTLSRSTDPQVAGAADAVVAALNDAVVANYTRDGVQYATGLTVDADTTHPRWLDQYQASDWAAETRWADLLTAVASTGR